MRDTFITLSLALISAAGVSLAATTEEWRSRTIYQVFTDRFAQTDGSTTAKCDLAASSYCGGTWQGVINQLDYIQDMGFDAIMISPITECLKGNTSEGESYHGYWPKDLYTTNSNFGTSDDLLALSKALHKRSMYLMVDVVINDMGYYLNSAKSSTIDYSNFSPFDDEKYYHSYCVVEDWSNITQIQNCNIGDSKVALLDLDTESDAVINAMGTWVSGLVTNYSVDGLRIDAAKHVNNAFLSEFVEAAGIFATGEVYNGGAGSACVYQNYIPSVTNYPVYFAAIQAFTASNITQLVDYISYVKSYCQDSTLLLSFGENHDLPRFASYTDDIALAKNFLAFTLLADGIPIVYQGQEQHFDGASSPYNREALWTSKYNSDAVLAKMIKTLLKMRNATIEYDAGYLTTQAYPIYNDGSVLVMRKGRENGQIVSVYSAQGSSGGSYNLSLATAFAPSVEVTEVLSCTTVNTSIYGQLTVEMSKGLPRIFVRTQNLNGTGLCGGIGDVAAQAASDANDSGSSRISLPQESNVLYIFLLGVFAYWLI
ncbi:MAG: hypothetical protein M1834_002691 [Cirrosporium novae-zelandiae]|nr:MAG: hypothetical protein M1834_002691 [Cirrosporium novae-zelandiae]